VQESQIKPPPLPSREFLSGRKDIGEAIRAAGRVDYRVWGGRKRSEREKELAREGRYIVFPGIVEPTVLVPPIDWLQDPFQSRSWRAQLHTLRLLDVLFQMYRKDGELDALKRARDIVLDWIAQNPHGKTGVSEYAWWDKVVGDRAPYFAYLLNASCQSAILSREQATTLLRSLVEHADYLADDRNYTHQTNHGLFQDAGLLLLARYLSPLKESQGWRAHGLARFLETIRRHTNVEEGVHLEHSPEYQNLTINLLGKVQELAEIDDPWLGELLERMRDAGRWFVLPDGMVAPIGDSDRVPAPKWAREGAEAQTGLGAFPSSGWAVVKAGGASLIVSAGYHSLVHKHIDDLSFYLHEQGEPVIVDAGKYGYDSEDDGRQYALSGAAHNGLLVDGDDVNLKAIKPYGSGIEWAEESDGWYAISATNKIALAQNVQHRRLFLYRPGSVLVLVDQVESRRYHIYTRLFHLGPGLEVSGEAELLELSGSSFRGLLHESTGDTVSGRLVRGQSEPVLQGWVFPEYRKWQETWTVEYESRCKSGIFVTTLSLQEGPVKASVRQMKRGTIEIAVKGSGSAPDFVVASTPQGLSLGRR
jgi:heparinase II/III-like protein